MKKLVLAVALTLSGFAIAQEDTELQVGIDNMMSELSEWYRTTRTFKDGDTDAPVLYGVLENIFTDSTAKHVYGVVNPRILELRINSYYHVSDDNTMSYAEWVNTIEMIDTAQFNVVYRKSSRSPGLDGSMLYSESVTIYSKLTGEEVRCILISYNGDNLRSIFDSFK